MALRLTPLFALHAVLWIAELAVTAVLWLVGVPLGYVLARRRAWIVRPSRAYPDGRMIAAWRTRWAWLWGNEEDGVTGPAWWHALHRDWPLWRRAFVWSAWRNPVNNLRFVRPFSMHVDPARIRVLGNCTDSPQDDWARERRASLKWCYVWQGVYAGAWARIPLGRRYLNLRIGWKLIPRDARGVPVTDYRSAGVGTGLQLQLRPIPFTDED